MLKSTGLWSNYDSAVCTKPMSNILLSAATNTDLNQLDFIYIKALTHVSTSLLLMHIVEEEITQHTC